MIIPNITKDCKTYCVVYIEKNRVPRQPSTSNVELRLPSRDLAHGV